MAEECRGFDVEFETLPSINVSCPICLVTMRNPVQTVPCSHQFCEACITRDKILRSAAATCSFFSTDATTHSCPVCNGIVENWFPDGAAERMILDLRVRCPSSGCLDTFNLRSLDDHLERSCKAIHNCEYFNIIGCKEQGTKTEITEHMESHIKQHLALAINGIKEMKVTNSEILREIKELKDDKDLMSREIKELRDVQSSQFEELEEKWNFLSKLMLKTTLLNRASLEISDFASKTKQVKETGTLIFESDKFYCLDGYHALFHVDINKNSDEDIYVSAGFILLRGPYDDDLKWPFEGKVTWTCRGDNDMEPMNMTFLTTQLTEDNVERSFGKPTSRNKAYGFPILLKNDDLNYVIDDKLKVEINVSKLKS